MTKEKKEPVKNNIASREDKDVVVDIKIDEKEPRKKQPGVPTNKKEAQELLDAYKARCERFPARMGKFKQKKDALEKWVDSFPK